MLPPMPGHYSIPETESTGAHTVQFYGDDDHLCETVADFLAAGLHADQPAVAIATPFHRKGIVEQLAGRDVDVERARHIGDLVLLDSADMLARVLVKGVPGAGLFNASVAGVLGQTARGREDVPIRVYAEMVDVLWRAGKPDAAIDLEALWNRLIATMPLSLLCGYGIGPFFKQSDGYHAVCAQHSHVANPFHNVPAAAGV
jgi:hypothetical protein